MKLSNSYKDAFVCLIHAGMWSFVALLLILSGCSPKAGFWIGEWIPMVSNNLIARFICSTGRWVKTGEKLAVFFEVVIIQRPDGTACIEDLHYFRGGALLALGHINQALEKLASQTLDKKVIDAWQTLQVLQGKGL